MYIAGRVGGGAEVWWTLRAEDILVVEDFGGGFVEALAEDVSLCTKYYVCGT